MTDSTTTTSRSEGLQVTVLVRELHHAHRVIDENNQTIAALEALKEKQILVELELLREIRTLQKRLIERLDSDESGY